MSFLCFAALLFTSAAAQPALLPATNLRTEYLESPLLLTTPAPRFSWVLPTPPEARGVIQGAYALTVFAGGNASGAPVWRSGRVASSAQSQVAYGGPPLAPDATFSWTVTWYDGSGAAAPPSSPALFGTAPGDDAAWDASGAQWIGCTGVGANSNLLRFDFSSVAPPGAALARATLYVSGLGWNVPYLNGERLTAAVFSPAFTHLRLRVLYTAHDVLPLLDVRGGNNTLAVALGNGWPAQFHPWEGNVFGEPVWNGTGSAAGALPPPTAERARRGGAGLGHGKSGYERRLRAWLSLRWSDGSSTAVVTSASALGAGAGGGGSGGVWMCGAGALLSDDIYAGVAYDARLETPGWTAPGFDYAMGAWGAAVRLAAPGGAMSPAAAQPVEVTNELPPCGLWESTPGVFVFDFCQNFAGVVRLSLPGPTAPGTVITIRHAESVMHPPYGAYNPPKSTRAFNCVL